MKVSYIIPEGQYTFFAELIEPLRARGIEVYVNTTGSEDTDLFLAAILPITHEWIDRIKRSGMPYILWHWDLFSFTNYSEPRWKQFLEMMPGATAIWSCSYETARQLKEIKGLESEVATAWVNLVGEVKGHRGEPYCLYAASGCGFGKRVEWAERACKLLGIKLEVLRGQSLSRNQYLAKLENCHVYVMPAFEESNGTIPAMEAAALGRPIVCADIPSNREVFGEGSEAVRYFPPNDFGRFKEAVWDAWMTPPDDCWASIQSLRSRIARLFSLDVVADRIAELLERAYVVRRT